MVLKRPFSVTLRKSWFPCSLFMSPGDRSLSYSPGETAVSQYSSFSGKMVLKRPFVSDSGEACACSFRASRR